MTVLDASAVLALVHDEPGADVVAAAIASATLGTANLAEVIGKLVDADIDIRRAATQPIVNAIEAAVFGSVDEARIIEVQITPHH